MPDTTTPPSSSGGDRARRVSDIAADYAANGYTVIRGFADAATCREQLDAAVELSRADDDSKYVIAEGNPATDASNPEDFVAKLFKLHRRRPFDRFAHDDRLLEILTAIIGPDVDVFLSQFIFKAPEAYGQPWHQDSYYFPFEASHQVGVWLAVTRATLENGCLWVVPGTHQEPIYDHVPDDRPHATQAYTKIVDRDMSTAVPMLMDPGDLLLFDSHVIHSSTDNESTELRAAFVCHYGTAGIADHVPPGVNVFDGAPVVRHGEHVPA